MKRKLILSLFVSELNVPKYNSRALPIPLTFLYNETTLSLSLPDLLTKCNEVYNSISLSVEQVPSVEEIKRQQSNSIVWFKQKFHFSFTIKAFSFLLDLSSLFVGASPDGTVKCTCSCCWHGVIEIKCPYSCKDQSFEDRAYQH